MVGFLLNVGFSAVAFKRNLSGRRRASSKALSPDTVHIVLSVMVLEAAWRRILQVTLQCEVGLLFPCHACL